MDIPKKLKDDIWDYCRLNDIVNIEEFIVKMVRQGYTIEKFGSTPLSNIEVEKIVEVPVEVIKEVIVEKEMVKEIPIEVIVEKEIVKEVPVEKIVTKIEYINDTTTEDELGGMIEKLKENISNLNQEIESERKVFSTKTQEMENNFQQEISKKDKEIEDLKTTIDNEVLKTENYKNEMSKKDKEIEELRHSLEEEKKNNNKNNDIYGDDRKGGWWGSNLLK